MGYHVIHTMAETRVAGPHELVLVDVDDLRHWTEDAVLEERRELRRIVEARMREALLDGRDPTLAMASIVVDLEERE